MLVMIYKALLHKPLVVFLKKKKIFSHNILERNMIVPMMNFGTITPPALSC